MKRKSGFYWHVHHDVLFEYCYNYDERVNFIKANKPKKEIPVRLNLMQPVKGKLPEEVVKTRKACGKAQEAFDKAWEAYGKASEAYDKAWEAYGKARDAYVKASEAYYKAREAYGKAREVYDKAWDAYEKALENNRDYLNKLHSKECPDCCWDGRKLDFEAALAKEKGKE